MRLTIVLVCLVVMLLGVNQVFASPSLELTLGHQRSEFSGGIWELADSSGFSRSHVIYGLSLQVPVSDFNTLAVEHRWNDRDEPYSSWLFGLERVLTHDEVANIYAGLGYYHQKQSLKPESDRLRETTHGLMASLGTNFQLAPEFRLGAEAQFLPWLVTNYEIGTDSGKVDGSAMGWEIEGELQFSPTFSGVGGYQAWEQSTVRRSPISSGSSSSGRWYIGAKMNF